MMGTLASSQARLADTCLFCYNICMNLKIIPIGNSLGVVFPKDLLAHLKVGAGELLAVAKSPDSVVMRAADGDFDAQLSVAREVMARRKRALRELAK